MSIIFARLSRRGVKLTEPTRRRIRSLLPFDPKSEDYKSFGSSEIIYFSWEAAFDIPLLPDEEGVLFAHGNLNSSTLAVISRQLRSHLPLEPLDFPQNFCALWLGSNQISFGTSAAGVDPLYYIDTDDEVIVTNRHNLLAPWIQDAPFRKEAFAWMIGRGHIGDWKSYWDSVRRAKGGDVYFADPRSRIEQNRCRWRGMFEPLEPGDIIKVVDDAAQDFGETLRSSPTRISFHLSGGKDSRSILGMLSRYFDFSEASILTGGELFSPDVMAATGVADMMGLTQHQINRPSDGEGAGFSFGAISNNLQSDAAGLSLADITRISRQRILIVGGHENGFKDKPNELEIDDYVESRRYWADSTNSLNRDYYDSMNRIYLRELRNVLELVPVGRYQQFEKVIFRNGTFLSNNIGNTHYCASELHPFLDARFTRMLMGIPDELLAVQFIHYCMARMARQPIETLPFAADAWPTGLEDLAGRMDIPFRGKQHTPFQFKRYFPSQRNFGHYRWRINLIDASNDFVIDYVRSNQFFDFVNFSRIESFGSVNPDTGINEIYARLGVLKACLVHYFANDILDVSKAAKIESELQKILKPKKDNSVAGAAIEDNAAQRIDERLSDYEKCISEQAIVIRDYEEKSINENKFEGVVTRIIKNIEMNQMISTKKLLRYLGFKRLNEKGLFVGEIYAPMKLIFRAKLYTKDVEKNRCLLKVSPTSKDDKIGGFTWSENGEFLYRYIVLPIENLIEEVGFSVDEEIAARRPVVSIHPWDAAGAIYVLDAELVPDQ